MNKFLNIIERAKKYINSKRKCEDNHFIFGCLNATGNAFTSLNIYKSINNKYMKEYAGFNQAEFDRWLRDSGDATLRLNYNLNEDSIVFDLGGYKGEWAANILQRYKSKIYVFEPVNQFYTDIKNRFAGNPNITTLNYGLGPKEETLEIGLTQDSSSIFDSEVESKEKIQIKNFVDFLKENDIENVDLLKINIEGGEYDLLEDLISQKKLEIFKNIQVQFHRFIPQCTERRNKIREELSKTHELTYDYEFVWENWTLKK